MHDAFGQKISFRQFGVEQGLSQSQVHSVVQDRSGYLWIGTVSGLNRFDGNHFDAYGRKDSLAEEFVTTACLTKDGNLYFGHFAGGLSYYSRETQEFTDLHFREKNGFFEVSGIAEGPSGMIWLSTRGAGLFNYDPASREITAQKSPDELFGGAINAIQFDANQRLWLATDKGLIGYDTRQPITEPTSFQVLTQENGLPGRRVTNLSLLDNGELVVICPQGTVLIKTRSNTIDPKGFIFLDELVGTPLGEVTTVMEDSRSNLWIGTSEMGAVRYDRNTQRHVVFDVDRGLNYNKVNSLYEDREGNIWIGTDVGLNQFRGEVFQLYDESDSLTNNIVWDILEDSRRDLWMATNQGVTRYTFSPDGAGNLMNVMQLTREDGLPNNTVREVFEDNKGDVWMATAFGGVCRFDTRSETIVLYEDINADGQEVYAINQDNSGWMWFGTRTGATRYDPETGERKDYTTADGLGGRVVYRIMRDSRNRMWFYGLGGDLAYFDGVDMRKVSLADVPATFLMSICEDNNGHKWLGSYDGGLFRYDGVNFEQFTTADGLSSNTVYSVIFDPNGNLWMGTGKGIDKLEIATGKVTNYGKQEGFNGVEANGDAVCWDGNRNLWFGTIMGAVRYNSREDRKNEIPPVTVIQTPEFLLGDTTFPEDGMLAYDQNDLKFRFVGISLSNPDKVRYQWRLEGLNKEWSEPAASVEAIYSNLDPGKYRFEVRAMNNDGVWSEEPEVVEFEIAPPFWQTLWFYLLLGVAAIGVIILIDKFRTRNLMDAKRMLENQVKKRTTELDLRNRELAAQNKHINDSIRYAQHIQQSLLPSLAEVEKLFPKSFVIHEAKEIVSGDFYWIDQHKDLHLMALMDCTGHGVPGAFLSVLGYNGLSRVLNERPWQGPGQMLTDFSELITDNLKKSESGGKDGFAIALLAYNPATFKLQFAGANNSLFIVRPAHIDIDKSWRSRLGTAVKVTHPENSYKLIEISGDKEEIEAGTNRQFTVEEFELVEGDTVYLFTDGIIEQFGGERGKKFKSNRLKQLLLYNQEKSMKEQGELLTETFREWKGDLDQIDDMTIIGFRVS